MRNAVAELKSSLAPLFGHLEQYHHLAVAVSGGSDSMALLNLLVEWRAKHCPDLLISALTVDHGLRRESSAEAAFVAAHCGAINIPHQTLNWQGAGSKGNLSAAARDGRYTLMAEACRKAGAQALLTAHTRDDQAETVLMRLSRGSGVDGLTGIRGEARLFDLPILRPLLEVGREQLRVYLRLEGIGWCEDPTNEDQSYDRVKARALLAQAEPLGLNIDRLVATAERLSLAQTVLEDAADELYAKAVSPKPQGYFVLDRVAFLQAREETALRVMARLIGALSGETYRPRFQSLRSFARVLSHTESSHATLKGCRLVASEKKTDNAAYLVRELAACPPMRRARTGAWDARFYLRKADCKSEAQIGPLGEAGWTKIARLPETQHLRDIPYAARLTLPALFLDNEVFALPSENISLNHEERRCVIEPLPPFGERVVEASPGMAI